MFKSTLCYLFLFISLSLVCSPAAAVELEIFNDLRENYSGSMLMVENAISVENPSNKINFKVRPGEKKPVTRGNVTSFVLVRVFPDHKLKYEILCPADGTGSYQITILQVHNNQLPANCKVSRTGHWSKRGGMRWEGL